MGDHDCLLCQLDNRARVEENYTFFDSLYKSFLNCNYGDMKPVIKKKCENIRHYAQHPDIDDSQIDREMKYLIKDIHEEDDYFHRQLEDHDGSDLLCDDCEKWAKYVSERLINEDWNKVMNNNSGVLDVLKEITGTGLPGGNQGSEDEFR